MLKPILTIIFLLVCWGTAKAQRGSLEVRLADEAPIMIELNRKVFREKSHFIIVSNIPAGRHRLRVFKPNRRGRIVVFDGYVRIRPDEVRLLEIDDRRGRLSMRSRSGEDQSTSEAPGRNLQDRNSSKVNKERLMTGGSILASAEFDSLRKTTTEMVADSRKLELLKKELSASIIYTRQLREMLGWLSFNSTRLELTKWAEQRIIDRELLSDLADAFNTEEAREEFRIFEESTRP